MKVVYARSKWHESHPKSKLVMHAVNDKLLPLCESEVKANEWVLEEDEVTCKECVSIIQRKKKEDWIDKRKQKLLDYITECLNSDIDNYRKLEYIREIAAEGDYSKLIRQYYFEQSCPMCKGKAKYMIKCKACNGTGLK